MPRNQGFTLVEVLVVIAILTLIGVFTIPNLKRFNDDDQLSNVSNKLISDLQTVRSNSLSIANCQSAAASVSWEVYFENEQSYRYKPSCTDLTTPPPITTTIPTNTRLDQIKTNESYCLLDYQNKIYFPKVSVVFNNSPFSVKFDSSDPATACFENSGITSITFVLLKGNRSTEVTINTAGLIYGQ